MIFEKSKIEEKRKRENKKKKRRCVDIRIIKEIYVWTKKIINVNVKSMISDTEICYIKRILNNIEKCKECKKVKE